MQKRYDENSTSGAKLLRLFRKLLLSKGKHTQSELAAYLNCSPQTIIRLISEIEREVGDNLETGKERNSRWYALNPNIKNMLGLDSDELRYLSLCRDLADPFLTDDIRKRSDEVLLRMSMMLSDISNEFAKPTPYTFFSKGKIDYSPYMDQIHCLEQSINDRLLCKIRYKKPNESEIQIISFAPSQFTCVNNALYIIGAKTDDGCVVDKSLISLAVHRILSVVITDKTVSFNIEKADIGDFGLPWGKEVKAFEITFKAGRASNYIKERLWCDGQSIEDKPNGDVVLSFKTRSSFEVFSWCRSFGSQIISVKVDGELIEDLNNQFI